MSFSKMSIGRIDVLTAYLRDQILLYYPIEKVHCLQCGRMLRVSSWVVYKTLGLSKSSNHVNKNNGNVKPPKIWHLKCYTRMWH